MYYSVSEQPGYQVMPSIAVESPRSYRRSQSEKRKNMAKGGSCSWLYEQMRTKSFLLLLDCRPFAEYARSHIQGAINLTIPSLMLRRLKKGNNFCVSSLISSTEAKTKFTRNMTLSDGVILYDGTTKDLSCVSPHSALGILMKKMTEDGRNVRVLEGGFTKFESKFPEVCEAGEEFDRPLLSLSGLTIQKDESDENSMFKTQRPRGPLLESCEGQSPVEIIPNLFLGNVKDSRNYELLKKHRISYILNVTDNIPNAFQHMDSFNYKKLPVEDNWKTNLASLFPEAFSFIDEGRNKKNGVLVHCLAGVSRSVTITIAYLMTTMNLNLNEAYDFVKEKKSNVSPNLNFMGQLLDYERQINSPRSPTSNPLSLGYERQLSTPRTPSSTTSTLSNESLSSEEGTDNDSGSDL